MSFFPLFNCVRNLHPGTKTILCLKFIVLFHRSMTINIFKIDDCPSKTNINEKNFSDKNNKKLFNFSLPKNPYIYFKIWILYTALTYISYGIFETVYYLVAMNLRNDFAYCILQNTLQYILNIWKKNFWKITVERTWNILRHIKHWDTNTYRHDSNFALTIYSTYVASIERDSIWLLVCFYALRAENFRPSTYFTLSKITFHLCIYGRRRFSTVHLWRQYLDMASKADIVKYWRILSKYSYRIQEKF